MKNRVLLLVIALAAGTLIIVTAQFLPQYKDALFSALPFLAILFGIVLLILNSRKKPRVEGELGQQERIRRHRLKNITAVIFGVILLGALAMIIYLPGDLIAIPVILIVIVCAGSVGMAFWVDRPTSDRPAPRKTAT